MNDFFFIKQVQNNLAMMQCLYIQPATGLVTDGVYTFLANAI